MRVGVDLISDPAFLVTRDMEDYVTWVDTSKIKQHIMKYNDKLDDFDLLGEYVCLFDRVNGAFLQLFCCNLAHSVVLLSIPPSTVLSSFASFWKIMNAPCASIPLSSTVSQLCISSVLCND